MPRQRKRQRVLAGAVGFPEGADGKENDCMNVENIEPASQQLRKSKAARQGHGGEWGEDIDELLIEATREGDQDACLSLLKSKANPNAISGNLGLGNHGPPLADASADGDIEMVRLLLRFKANPNSTSPLGSALQQALHGDHFALAKVLLRAKADPDQGGLDLLCARGCLTGVQVLLANRANPNASYSVGRHEGDRGGTPLFEAAINSHIDVARVLMTAKANVREADDLGRSVIMRVAGHGPFTPYDLRGIQYLLERQADPNARDHKGRNAIFSPAVHGRVDVVDLLLQANADVACRDRHKLTPLGLVSKAIEGKKEWKESLLFKDDTGSARHDGWRRRDVVRGAPRTALPRVATLLARSMADAGIKEKANVCAHLAKLSVKDDDREFWESLKCGIVDALGSLALFPARPALLTAAYCDPLETWRTLGNEVLRLMAS
uniref:Uncharacterized protein n=1 Tax=Lotharella oceanica TaxID=641309 RepID=A0A7S2X8G9_9EUKA|mmetsp:Transcript_13455/g.25681  ORF Transcript_13455/g.25681 Transcript_13455/m.25681 type:complete len:437 (+) Transcript_13455:47-1357(+)